MNVLLILPTDSLAGGAQLNLKRIAESFKAKGAKVTVIFLSRGDNGNWCDLGLERLIYVNASRELIGAIKAIPIVALWRLRKESFDYSFSSHIHCNAYIGALLKLNILEVKKVICRESTNTFILFKGFKQLLFKFLYLFYPNKGNLICQTEFMKESLLQNVKYMGQLKVLVVENPVEYCKVRMLSRQASDNSPEAELKEIVTVGRFTEEKGFDIAIRSFSKLLKKDKKFLLRLIGDGPLRAEMEALAEREGIIKNVIFMGHNSNPMPYMKRAFLCVVPSYIEGFPNTLLEMMCVSRRIVATECNPSIKNIPGITTCLAGDEEELCLTIEQVISYDAKTVKENIVKMRKHVKGRTVEDFVRKSIY